MKGQTASEARSKEEEAAEYVSRICVDLLQPHILITMLCTFMKINLSSIFFFEETQDVWISRDSSAENAEKML